MTDARQRKKHASCPVCGKNMQASYRPFCSRGCKDRDLLQWLGEGYRIQGPAAPPRHDGDMGDE